MAVLKCTVCGGELEVNEDMSVGVCKFCDSTIVIPKNLDKKGNLYNRAVFLRQNNEFDKAASAYEDILKEDNTDSDAHWGLVLSKYGIEYVHDPRSGQHVPTCHRTQAASILTDPDYLAALEYADTEARRVIEKDANRINEILTKIIEISREEPPYDIFICYKESDEIGNRTEDSTLAQDLYYELVKKGYKVFFARKTLENKLGSEYEPIIYAALNSAKVMVVLGTKAENFSSVWVRNEWSRFLKMSKDSQKTIIPAYRGISPYELPAELSALQSLNMSKIGFVQDLLDGIERCVHRNRPVVIEEQTRSDISHGPLPIERLLQNGETYLRLRNYASAKEVYREIAKDYPEDYRGWWGLIVSSTNNLSVASETQAQVDTWYKYVKTLCPPNEYGSVEQRYVEYLKLVAEVDANLKIKMVKKKIEDCESAIIGHQQQIKHIEEEKIRQQSNYKTSLNGENRALDNLKRIAVTADKKYVLYKAERPFFLVGGIITGLFWMVLLIDQIANPSNSGVFINILSYIFLFLLLMIPIGLFSSFADLETYEKAVNDAKKGVEAQEKKINDLTTKYQSSLKIEDGKISEANEWISAAGGYIASLHQYIDEKPDELKPYFHSERCRAIGVSIPFSGDVSFPKFVLDKSEHKGLKCPACESVIPGNILSGKQGETIQCPVCGYEFAAI